MGENYQDKAGSRLIVTENKLWLPPLSPKDQKKLKRLQNSRKKPLSKWTGFAGKTLWDWMQLLIIPLVLAGGAIWFNSSQHETDMQIAAAQQQEEVLVTYQKDISDLLLTYKLRTSKEGEEVREVARTRTLIALRQLDPDRKGLLIQFLYEAHLIDIKSPIISLSHADISGANLSGIRLSTVRLSHEDRQVITQDVFSLSHADLSEANLSEANLSFSTLNGVNLQDTILIGADLTGANLFLADLTGADLTGADLTGATVTNEQLKKAASLQGATIPDGSIHP